MFDLSHTVPDLTIEPINPVTSSRGIALEAPNRGNSLRLKVSATMSGTPQGLVIFSHGYGASMDAYAPLADYWAASGYVVIQPTHLDAYRMAIGKNDPRRSRFWIQRVEDIKNILDHLNDIENAFPLMKGAVDSSNIVMAGHSFGGQTTQLLLGGRMQGAGSMAGVDMTDSRIKNGLLFAAGGAGGEQLSEMAKEHLPYLDMEFSQMNTPFMAVVGNKDNSILSKSGPEWFYDPFNQAPGAQAMLTLHDAEHMLGGISGYAVKETTDENPERVSIIQEMTLAYLNWQIKGEALAWHARCEALNTTVDTLDRIDLK